METRTCRHCLKEKPASDFYASDRHGCKECIKERVRLNRAKKVEYYRLYDAKRYRNDPRVKERMERYQRTDAYRASVKKTRANWLKLNPEKRAAHVLLGNAITRGIVVRPELCEDCGSPASGKKGLHGHHEDYTKPLEVNWLCHACHAKRHSKYEV